MKKLYAVITIFILLIGLSSCSSSTTPSDTSVNNRGGSTELIKDDSRSFYDGKTKYYLRGDRTLNCYATVSTTAMTIYINEKGTNYDIIVINENHFRKDDGTIYYIDSDIIISYGGNKMDYYLLKVIN